MYNFFSIPGVYIDNRGQFFIPLFIYFRGFQTAHRVDRVLSLFSSRPNWDPPPRQTACRRGGGESQFGRGDRHCGSLGIYVLCGTASLENLPNKFCKNPRNLRVCGRFLMCFPAIDRQRENTCEIFKMINMIAGEHIPVSIEINNVYARYRLDSGKTSPAIFRHLKCVNQNLFKARQRENISRYRVDSGNIHNGIEFLTPVAT